MDYPFAEQMKILFILGSSDRSAPNNVVYNIIKYVSADCSVLFLSPRSENDYFSDMQKDSDCIFGYGSVFAALRDQKKVQKLIQKSDMIVLNTFRPNMLYFLLKILRAKLPITFAICHSVEALEGMHTEFDFALKIKGAFRRGVNRYVYKQMHKVICVSKAVADYVGGFSSDNTTVIYNGTEKYDCLYKKNDHMNIVQVGHIKALKNQLYSLDLLTELVNRGHSPQLYICGSETAEPDYCEKIKLVCKERKLERFVKFTGHLNQNEVFEILDMSNILLMPSLSEGLPLALVEALHCGLIPVVSNVGGMPELCNQLGPDYSIILSGSVHQDAQKLIDFCASDELESKSLFIKSFASKNLQAKDMAKRYEALFETLF
jgi:glycosyltransferase involved in cell wall biosynthesis